jgi:hypothetical protein
MALLSAKTYILPLFSPFLLSCDTLDGTAVPLPFRHKLNYFLVLSNFWKIIHYTSQNFSKRFKKSSSLDKLDCSITMTSFYLLFFTIFNCQKNSELKKPRAKVKISNLNNYSAVCFRNGKGTTRIESPYSNCQVLLHKIPGTGNCAW